MTATLPPRRRLLVVAAGASLLALPTVWRAARAQMPASAAVRRTPAQTEGPFYPLELPADADSDLLRNGSRVYAAGQPALVQGRLTDLAGAPLRGGVVEIWQCDADGHYHHPGDGGRADPAFQGFGRVAVDDDGRYRFRTLRPAAYSGRTPHIHVKVRLGRRDLLTTQLYVAGDPGNERDFLWRRLTDPADRAALTVPFEASAEGLKAWFPIAVAA